MDIQQVLPEPWQLNFPVQSLTVIPGMTLIDTINDPNQQPRNDPSDYPSDETTNVTSTYISRAPIDAPRNFLTKTLRKYISRYHRSKPISYSDALNWGIHIETKRYKADSQKEKCLSTREPSNIQSNKIHPLSHIFFYLTAKVPVVYPTKDS